MPDNPPISAKEQSAVRAVLRNEITWILFIIGSAWGIVVGVVLPIQALQIQLAQVQTQILDIKSGEANLPQIEQDHAVMKQEIDALQTNLTNFEAKDTK